MIVTPHRLKLTRPLVIFDLETTGLDPETDRIVEIGAVKLASDDIAVQFHARFNPGVVMTPEIIAIHGITNEQVSDLPTFAERAAEIVRFFADADIVGFNVKFDFDFLKAELARVPVPGDGPPSSYLAILASWNPRILDAMEIFKRYEKRGLREALQFYCKAELSGAHSAMCDASDTARVFLAQTGGFYPDLPDTIEGLDKLLNAPPEGYLDKDKKLKWDGNEVIIDFGQHKGKKLRDTPVKYLRWILDKDFSDTVKNTVKGWLENRCLPVRVTNA